MIDAISAVKFVPYWLIVRAHFFKDFAGAKSRTRDLLTCVFLPGYDFLSYGALRLSNQSILLVPSTHENRYCSRLLHFPELQHPI